MTLTELQDGHEETDALTEAIEIMKCTSKAVKSIQGVAIWKQ